MPIELVDANETPKRNHRKLALICGAVLLAGTCAVLGTTLRSGQAPDLPAYLQCDQPPLLAPDFAAQGVADSSQFLAPSYQKKSVKLLANAVQIPTVSYDDMSFNVTDEPRFDVFKDLHAFLFKKFPLLAERVETVNTYGLLYTIPGSDPSLKPVVFMAHQDVVPVAPETAGDWEHDPFSGDFDGDWIHGRGTSDTKNSLVAMHEAVESLLAQHWTPRHTLLLSFGFDEEIQGFRGARKLAERIEEQYGPDGVEIIIDEGFGIVSDHGVNFASPAVAEKGRVNFRSVLNTPGGHSSAPPDHTGIGIMSDFITLLESDVPLPPSLPRVDGDGDAVRGRFACLGRHGDLPDELRDVYTNLGTPLADAQLVDLLSSEVSSRILVETTQAIDTIRGGVKVNALPEQVTMEVNYRVKPASSVELETKRFLAAVDAIAEKYSLNTTFYNPYTSERSESHKSAAAGTLNIEVSDSLDVAPVSPFYNSTHWDVLSGTSKHVYEDVVTSEFGEAPLVVTPGLMTGNTDTAHYWNLTKNIYRYVPVKLDTDARNIHTVNEGLRARSHIASVIFYYEFLLNAQAL